MHFLTGFIQLLIIFSNSENMPDLSAIWHKAETVTNSSLPDVRVNSVECPTSEIRRMVLEAIQEETHDPLLLLPPSGLIIINRASASEINITPRVVYTRKLYLKYCQMKIEC